MAKKREDIEAISPEKVKDERERPPEGEGGSGVSSSAHARVSAPASSVGAPATPAEPRTTEHATAATIPLNPLKLITWIGASTGGLTILLLAVGYLAESAHDVMLGIPRSIQPNQEYVVVGGLFFGRSVIFALAALRTRQSLVTFGVFLIALLLFFFLRRKLKRHKAVFVILTTTGLAGLEIYTLWRLVQPLQISNLLLSESEYTTAPSKVIVDALLVKDVHWLGAEYGFMVLLVLLSAFVFRALEVQHGGEFKLWRWLRAPVLGMLIICLFLLPRAYGILAIPNAYPQIDFTHQINVGGDEVTRDSPQTKPGAAPAVHPASSPVLPSQDAPLFLLRESEHYFYIYNPSIRSIITVKRDAVEQHRVLMAQDVFSPLARH